MHMNMNRIVASLGVAAALAVSCRAVPAIAQGRRGAGATPAAPLTVPPEGKATGPIPRLPNGKPDFSGTFDHPRVGDITKPSRGCTSPTPGCVAITDTTELPLTPAGAAEQKKEPKFDYGLYCLPWGYVRSTETPFPHGYMQNNTQLVIMWEQDNFFHVVPTTGKPLPPNSELEPTWMGTSAGRWEGDTLVIETGGFNAKTWVDTAEHVFSDELRTVERMSYIDKDHIRYELTMTDPKYWTKPIKNTRIFSRMTTPLLEYSCEENNKEIKEGFYLTNNPLKK
jgi:hypothetical protein